MTPQARFQTAAEILDLVAEDVPAERALTNWARGARFAGSKDRAAVRDIVFDALRRWRSAAVAGGGLSGREVVLGLLRLDGTDPATVFTGARHAPAPLTAAEADGGAAPVERDLWDLPGWLCDSLEAAHGDAAAEIAGALRHRAPVTLRVNTLRCDLKTAAQVLASEDIITIENALSPTALTVTGNARRIAASAAYRDGLVELQDAASQAVVDRLPLAPGARVLDLCAGGGGKTLAMAARHDGPIHAWDADPGRMRDLPARAARAGARIDVVDAPKGPYDVILTDAPCSGSGAWRRSPEAKWRLTPEGLEALMQTQDAILDRAAGMLSSTGILAYATCSVLAEENVTRIDAFLSRNTEWRLDMAAQFLPDDRGDGFYTAHLMRV